MPWKPPVHKPAHCIRARSEHRPSAARRGYGYRWQKYVKWFVMNNPTPIAKSCKKCGVPFLGARCKPCFASYMRAWNAKNPEKVRAWPDM